MEKTINFDTSRWNCEMCNTDDTLYDLRELDDYSSISKTESSSVPYPQTTTGSIVPSMISESLLTIDSDCEWFNTPEDSAIYLVMSWSQLYDTNLEDLIKYRDILDDNFIDLPRSIWKYVNDQMFFIHQLERKGTPPVTDT
jgi:hypothetical protein